MEEKRDREREKKGDGRGKKVACVRGGARAGRPVEERGHVLRAGGRKESTGRRR